MTKYLCIQRYPNRLCSGCTSACCEPVQVSATVRDWQTDSAHDTKPHPLRGDTQPTPWSVKHGIEVQPHRGHTTAWAIRLVISCQKARATEAC